MYRANAFMLLFLLGQLLNVQRAEAAMTMWLRCRQNLLDATPRGNDATGAGLVNRPDFCGTPNSAVSLDSGPGSYILPPGDIWESASDFSFGFRFKSAQSTPSVLFSVFASEDPAFLELKLNPGSGTITLTFNGSTYSDSLTLQSTWNHFLVTRASTVFTIYVNGAQQLSSGFPDVAFPANVASNAFVIGQRQTALGVYDGELSSQSVISDIRFFNVSLGADQALREGLNPVDCTRAVQDRPFIHHRLQGNNINTANLDGDASFAATNVNENLTDHAMCWDSSLFYDGQSAHTKLGAALMLTALQDFTVSIWLQETKHDHDATFFSVSGSVEASELAMTIIADDGLVCYLNGEQLWEDDSGKGLLDDGVNFVAFQREGMVVRLFVNGKLEIEQTQPNAFPIGNVVPLGVLLASHTPEAESQLFEGYLNDLQVWSRALTAQEIAGMHNRKCKNLVHWWPLDGLDFRDRGTDPVALTMNVPPGLSGPFSGVSGPPVNPGTKAGDGNCVGSNRAVSLAGTSSSYLVLDGFKAFKERLTDFTVTAIFFLPFKPTVSAVIFSIAAPQTSNELLIAIGRDLMVYVSIEKIACLLTSTETVSLNTWHHVAATRAGVEVKLFLDGKLVGSTSCTANLISPVSEAYVGNAYENNVISKTTAFSGRVFDVRFYNYAFTTAVETLRGCVPACVKVLNRILHYSLTSITGEHDRSGNQVVAEAAVSLTQSKSLCGRNSLTWPTTRDSFSRHLNVSASAEFMAGANDFTVSILLFQSSESSGQRCFFSVAWLYNDRELTCCVGLAFTISCWHPTNPEVAYTTTSTIALAKATHFALVRDGLELMFYLDGVLDSTHRLGTQLPFGPTSSVFLGEVKDGRVFGKTWEGAMAEFKMWNRALSASEVADDSTMCQSLVGWWRMEGDMNDSSRAQQTGSVAGSVEPGTDSCGRAGRSLHFGGTGSDYATLPTPEYYTGLQDFTVSTWVYCQSLVNDPGLFSMHSLGETNELMLQPQENGTIALVLRGTSYISDEAAITELDKWYHIAAVRLWDTLTLYVDGSVFHTTSCVVDPLLPMVGIVFGQDHENLQSFEGNLRDFRIYNYALTDVRGLQGLPSPPACPTFNNQPVFRYKMDSLEMKDSSGNGVLSGMLDTVTAGEPLIRCLSVPCTGESLNFPGNSASTGFGAIPAGPLLSGINDFTVSFWVKDLDPSAGGVAVNLFAQYSDATSCDDEIVFRRDTGDVLSVHINCEEFRSAESMFPSDRSIMWTVTRRGREVAVYRNGLLLTSFDHPRQVPIGWIPPNGTYVGHAVVGTPDAGKAWEGVVADFQFWEGAMAAAEVAKAYETAFCDCPAAHSETVSRFALNGNFNETGAADQGSDGGSFSISRDSVCGGSLAVGEGIQHTLRTTARPSKAFTMALYAKPVLPFSSGVRVLLHVGGPDARSGFGFGVDANHRLVIRDSPDAGGLRSLDVEVEPGWRHYVVVYNGEAMVIYVDELVVYEEVVYLTLPTADSWGQLSVGGVDGDTEGGTDGEWLVDEIVLFEGAAAVADARSLCDLRAVFSRYTADAESNLLLDYGPAHNEGHGVTSYGSSFVCGRAVVLYENEEHCIHPAREVPLYAEPWTVSAYAFAPVPGDRAFVHLGDDESEGRGFGLGFMQGSLVWSTKSGEWKVVHPARTIIASHHYAATYDSNVIRFYIDEEEVGAVNYTFDLRKGSEQSSMCVGCTRCGDAPEMKHGTWRIDEAVFARGVIPMAEMRARCAIPARGPFARYPLDEDLVDISPAGNVLPGVFNPSSESICGGGSLQLDKEFLHTSVAAMDAPHLGPWTISLYAKRVEKGLQTSRRVLLRFRSGVTQVGFGVDDDDKLIVFLARTETLQPSVPIPVDDDWHHYTLTFNGSMLQLYMDEVMEADWAFEYNLAGLTTVPTISIGDTGSSFNDGVWLVDEVVFGRGVLPHAALRCPAVVSHLPLNGGWNDLGPANNEFPGEYEGDDDTVCGGSLRVPPGKLHVSENWKQLARGAEAWAVMLYAKCIVPGKRLFFAVGNLASLHAGIGLGVSGNGGLVLQVSSGRHIPVNATKVDRFWHRYAVAYNGSRVEVFVDDALVFGVDWPLDLQSDRFAIAAGAAEGEWLFDELVVGHGPVHLHFRSTCGTREVFTKYSFDGNFADTAVAENNNPTANLQFVDDSMCGKSLLLDDNVFYALDNTNTEPGSVHWSMANYAACIKGEASSSTCDGKPLRDVLQEVTFCDCSEGCTVFPKGLPQKSEPWTVSLYVKGKVGGNRAFIQLGQAGRELGHFSFGVGAGMQLWISLGGPPRDIAGLSAELGSWNHYVAAYDSNLLTVFVDGVAVHEEYVVLNLPRCSEMGNLVIGSQLGPLQRDTRRGEWLFDDIRLGLGVVPFDKLQQLCDTGAPLSPPVVPP